MSTYVVRPTSMITRNATFDGSTNATTGTPSGASATWSTGVSGGVVASYFGDNNDATAARVGQTLAGTITFALGAPSIASGEYVARVGGLIRWSRGKTGYYVGCQPYRAADVPPTGFPSISSNATQTSPITSEPGYQSVTWSPADCGTLRLSSYMDGSATVANRPWVHEFGATIYTIANGTTTVANKTETSNSAPTIPVSLSAVLDTWQTTTQDWQLIRYVTVLVQIEASTASAPTSNPLSSGYAHVLLDATASGQNVDVQLNKALTNTTYKIFARAIRYREGQTLYSANYTPPSEQFGAWSTSATLTMSVTPPTTPTVSVTADNTNKRAAVTVTLGSAGSYTSPTYTLERSDDGGTTWSAVRGQTDVAAAFSTAYTVYDYEANYGSASQYRATVTATIISARNTSQPSSAASVTITADTWNLKNPANAAGNMIGANVTGTLAESLDETVGVFRPLDRRYPVIVAGPLTGWDGELTVMCTTAGEWTTITGLLEAQAVLRLESPFGWAKYIRINGGAQVGSMGTSSAPRREVKFSYVETTAP